MKAVRSYALAVRVVVLAVTLAAIAARSKALEPCRSEYDDSREAVARAYAPAGAQQSVLKQLQKAWTAHAASPAGNTNALLQTESAKQTLGGLAFHDVSGEQTAKIGAAIDSFAACLRDLDAGGGTSATTSKRQVTTLDEEPSDPGDFAVIAELQIDEAQDAVVPRGFAGFTMRLLDSEGQTIPVATIVELQLLDGGNIGNVASAFSITTTGAVVAADPAALRDLLADKFGPYEVRLRALDPQGQTYQGSVHFDLGRYTAHGIVQAPAGVDASSVPVRLTNQRDHFSFWETTASGGALTFPALLPEGPYIVSCEFVRDGMRYHVADAFVLDANKTFTITVTPAIAASN
jgi:hypothetical protein